MGHAASKGAVAHAASDRSPVRTREWAGSAQPNRREKGAQGDPQRQPLLYALSACARPSVRAAAGAGLRLATAYTERRFVWSCCATLGSALLRAEKRALRRRLRARSARSNRKRTEGHQPPAQASLRSARGRSAPQYAGQAHGSAGLRAAAPDLTTNQWRARIWASCFAGVDAMRLSTSCWAAAAWRTHLSERAANQPQQCTHVLVARPRSACRCGRACTAAAGRC